jgi:LPS export ABC transporter protein LptC
MSEAPQPRVHVRPMRAVTALRVLILLVLAGVTLALALTYGRKGKPQTEITMAPASATPPGQGPVVDQADEFEINGTREGRPSFTLRARTVTGFAGERKLLEGVHLTIHQDDGGAINIAGSTGHFDAASRRAQIVGDVVIEGGEGVSLRTGTLFYDSDRDMIFTADEVAFSAARMEGTGRGLNYLVGERRIKIPDEVRLQIRPDDDGEVSVISAGDLVATLPENRIILTDDVRLNRGRETLRANYLSLQFEGARHELAGMKAFGDVGATLVPERDGAPSDLRADSLTARFGPSGDAVEEVEASGSCRVSSGPYTSRSRGARFVRQDDRLELRGDPVVLTERDRIAAQEIDLHPKQRVLEARGDVRTVSLPGAGGEASSPGFSPRSALSFQAADLRVDDATHRAVYSGAARAWQEGSSIQAEEIAIDQEARTLKATGHVVARFTQRPATSPAPAARPVVTSIVSDDLVYEDARGVGAYRGNVRLTRDDTMLTSDAMDAYLKEVEGHRELDHIEASGSVAVKRAGSFGTARHATYQGGEDLLILRDEEGLAEVVDAATGRTMRGRTLTFDLAGDRILTESERGGRTWITLTPDSKDVPAVEPQTRR